MRKALGFCGLTQNVIFLNHLFIWRRCDLPFGKLVAITGLGFSGQNVTTQMVHRKGAGAFNVVGPPVFFSNGDAVDEVQGKVLKSCRCRLPDHVFGPFRAVDAPHPLQNIRLKALHTNAKPVNPRSFEAIENVGIEVFRIGLERPFLEVPIGLRKGHFSNLLKGRRRQETGSATTEIQGGEGFVLPLGQRRFELLDQGLHHAIAVPQFGREMKVAVGARLGAKGNVHIETGHGLQFRSGSAVNCVPCPPSVIFRGTTPLLRPPNSTFTGMPGGYGGFASGVKITALHCTRRPRANGKCTLMG